MALIGIALAATACGTAGAHPGKQTRKPPDAYLTAHGVRTRMAGGSYCWTVTHGSSGVTGCADTAGWSRYPHFPQIRANRGDKVTVSFGFPLTKAVEVDFGHHSTFVPAGPRPTLTVPGHGILQVVGHGSQGDASYGIRIVPRSG